MKEKPVDSETLVVTTHDDLRRNIRNINRRFMEHPDIGRMLIVNPILALEDLGVQLSDEIKQHIMNSLRFPKSLQERRRKLETELHEEMARLGKPYTLPLNATQRADLLFGALHLAPQGEDAVDQSCLSPQRTRCYKRQHPLAAKLAEYERVRQGALVFHTRQTYEDYKAGRKQHRWLKAVHFRT